MGLLPGSLAVWGSERCCMGCAMPLARCCSGTKHQLARSGSGSAIPSCVRAPIDVHLPPFRCVPQGKPDLLLPHLQQLSLNDAVDAQA